jgi:uracil-DNA glycosylase family 4
MPQLTDQRRQILEEMGIDIWSCRDKSGMAADSLVNENSLPEAADISLLTGSEPGNDWLSLQRDVQSCEACNLSKSRTQTVFGSGDSNAELLLIGEAPGAEEDRQGMPFVGKAGKLLDAMLFAISLKREQVFICNVLKCRPPNNRNPQADEVASCASFLAAQIESIKPRIILALGGFAAHSLLETDLPVYKMRENLNVLPGTEIPVVVTYHPASLVRNPEQKAESWTDLCKVNDLLGSTQP